MSRCARFVLSVAPMVYLILALLSSAGPARAGDRPGADDARLQWTRVQDLKPDARAANRPVKDKWAVVVGVNRFVEQSLNNDLRMDEAARDFYSYLIDPRAGRFDREHVRLLVNADATRQNILAAAGPQWLGQVAGADDLVVVFIATHGFPAADGNTYICAHNSALDNLFATGISMQSFMQSLRRNVKSDRIVLILQACYSGAAELTAGAKSLFRHYNIDLDKVALGKGYVILSSSKPDQITWGDVFSSHLVKSLREEEGLVPLPKAFAVARERTEYDTTHDCVGCKPQTPIMKADWTGNELVLGVPPLKKVKAIPQGAANFLAAEAHYMLASKHAAAGDLDQAVKEYEAAVEVDRQYADAYCDLGAVLALKGDWGGAAKKLEEALAIRPEDGLFRYNYARCLAKLGRAQEAALQLERAYAVNPRDRLVLVALGDVASRSGNYEGAARYIGEALSLYPRSADLHNRLSYVLARQGQFPGALSHAQEAVNLDPKSASAHLNLGSLRMLTGEIAWAKAAYRQAIELAPDNADAHYLLASALEKSGDTAAAQAELSKFLEHCRPEDPRADEVRLKLKAPPAGPGKTP